MLELTQRQYEDRVPTGYPMIVDDVARGTVGIELDPNFALYITQDVQGLSAEVYRRLARIDSRATASRQKYGGERQQQHAVLHLLHKSGDFSSAHRSRQPGHIRTPCLDDLVPALSRAEEPGATRVRGHVRSIFRGRVGRCRPDFPAHRG